MERCAASADGVDAMGADRLAPTKCQAAAPAASKRAIARADSASTERLLGALAAESCAGALGVATFASACAPTCIE
jgi:hypothetical protein